MWVIWVLVAILLVAAELHTSGFIAVFVALGAVVAAIVAAIGLGFPIQIVACAIVAVASTLLLRKRAIARFSRGLKPLVLTGPAALIGQTSTVLEPVGDAEHPGHVLLGGERWLAVSDLSTTIPPEQAVVVMDVKGTTLVVRPKE